MRPARVDALGTILYVLTYSWWRIRLLAERRENAPNVCKYLAYVDSRASQVLRLSALVLDLLLPRRDGRWLPRTGKVGDAARC